MLETSVKKQCNGCKMCADICPKNAIFFQRDSLTGFDYPAIDDDLCVHCNKCDSICPQINPVYQNERNKPEVLAAWSLDDEKRMLCTSGGIFYEVAHKVILSGGVVVACRYTDDFRGSYHSIAETEEDLIPLCGSKYVQSNTFHIYPKIQKLLQENRFVFFVGTPCQVAALYRFVGNDFPNLLTADFICNSINSPKAQEKYIDYLEDEYQGKIVFSRAKDKRYGWNNFGSSAKFDNGKEYYADRNNDMRVVGYHHGHLFIRESCSDCKYKTIPRNADITLGDFWGIKPDERNPKLEKGTSVVLLNSKKGADFLRSIPRIDSYSKSFDEALAGNGSLLYSAQLSPDRFKAFAELDKSRFDVVVNKYRNDRDRVTIPQRAKRGIIQVLRKVVRSNGC